MRLFRSGGIYLLLGYSSIDEDLLRAYTNLGIQDTVRAFQQYLHNHIDNQVIHRIKLSHFDGFSSDFYSPSIADVVRTASIQYNRREYNNYS